jgi:hypothetical protein
MGELDREYEPIRITQDERLMRKHELIMTMTDDIVNIVINSVMGKKTK